MSSLPSVTVNKYFHISYSMKAAAGRPIVKDLDERSNRGHAK